MTYWHLLPKFYRSTTRPIVMNRRNVCHWRVVERFWTIDIAHRERSKTTKTWQFLENLENFGSAQFWTDWGWTMKTVQFERFERIERFEQSSRLVDCFRRTEVLPYYDQLTIVLLSTFTPRCPQTAKPKGSIIRSVDNCIVQHFHTTMSTNGNRKDPYSGLRFFFSTIARGFSRREIRAHRLSKIAQNPEVLIVRDLRRFWRNIYFFWRNITSKYLSNFFLITTFFGGIYAGFSSFLEECAEFLV